MKLLLCNGERVLKNVQYQCSCHKLLFWTTLYSSYLKGAMIVAYIPNLYFIVFGVLNICRLQAYLLLHIRDVAKYVFACCCREAHLRYYCSAIC